MSVLRFSTGCYVQKSDVGRFRQKASHHEWYEPISAIVVDVVGVLVRLRPHRRGLAETPREEWGRRDSRPGVAAAAGAAHGAGARSFSGRDDRQCERQNGCDADTAQLGRDRLRWDGRSRDVGQVAKCRRAVRELLAERQGRFHRRSRAVRLRSSPVTRRAACLVVRARGIEVGGEAL